MVDPLALAKKARRDEAAMPVQVTRPIRNREAPVIEPQLA
jgi:hypothetical protein